MLELKESTQSFSFDGFSSEPVASVLRDFSAPVVLNFDQSDEDLAFLMAYDTDSFNRWDAGNRLSSKLILSLAKLPLDQISSQKLPDNYINSFKQILNTCRDGQGDYSLTAYALQLPGFTTLSLSMPVILIDPLLEAIKHVKTTLAKHLVKEFEDLYDSLNTDEAYSFDPQSVGRRRLKNTCLDYIMSLETPSAVERATKQFNTATCTI